MFAGTPASSAPYASVSPQLMAALVRAGRPAGVGQAAQGLSGGFHMPPEPASPQQTVYNDGPNGSTSFQFPGLGALARGNTNAFNPGGAIQHLPELTAALQGGQLGQLTPVPGSVYQPAHPVVGHIHAVDAAQQLARQLTQHYQATLRNARLR